MMYDEPMTPEATALAMDMYQAYSVQGGGEWHQREIKRLAGGFEASTAQILRRSGGFLGWNRDSISPPQKSFWEKAMDGARTFIGTHGSKLAALGEMGWKALTTVAGSMGGLVTSVTGMLLSWPALSFLAAASLAALAVYYLKYAKSPQAAVERTLGRMQQRLRALGDQFASLQQLLPRLPTISAPELIEFVNRSLSKLQQIASGLVASGNPNPAVEPQDADKYLSELLAIQTALDAAVSKIGGGGGATNNNSNINNVTSGCQQQLAELQRSLQQALDLNEQYRVLLQQTLQNSSSSSTSSYVAAPPPPPPPAQGSMGYNGGMPMIGGRGSNKRPVRAPLKRRGH
jgi:hypothetical protein